MTIIAWQYNADRYCTDCTEKKYPGSTSDTDPILVYDNGGDEILPVLSHDEWYDPDLRGCEVMECGDCGKVLDVAHDIRCPNRVISDLYNEQCIPIGD